MKIREKKLVGNWSQMACRNTIGHKWHVAIQLVTNGMSQYNWSQMASRSAMCTYVCDTKSLCSMTWWYVRMVCTRTLNQTYETSSWCRKLGTRRGRQGDAVCFLLKIWSKWWEPLQLASTRKADELN